MSYRNKTYVIFDGDDIQYYRLMQAWKENDNIEFDFNDAHDIGGIREDSQEETVKKHLRERFLNSKQIIVLVGENTKYKYKYVRWEIEVAQDLELPIIVVNLNNIREIDNELCPAILRDCLAMHISYNRDIIKYALDNWPAFHASNKDTKSGPYYYKKSVYEELDL